MKPIRWRKNQKLENTIDGYIGRKKMFSYRRNDWVKDPDKEDWYLLCFTTKDLNHHIFKTEEECEAHAEIMLNELRALLNE